MGGGGGETAHRLRQSRCGGDGVAVLTSRRFLGMSVPLPVCLFGDDSVFNTALTTVSKDSGGSKAGDSSPDSKLRA